MESLKSTDVEAHDGDRALRDELERLQSQLQKARQALATEQAREPQAQAEARAALEAATTRRDAARAHLAALLTQAQTLEASCARLDEQVDVRKQEDQVLALGAQRRDQSIDWANRPEDERWKAAVTLLLILLLTGLGYWALGAL